MKNILIVGAHYDDAELGAGGTAAKLAAEGKNVYKLTLTDNVTKFSQMNINVAYEIAAGYSSSTKYQDRTKAFNDRVVMVLIRHLESYLTKVGIDMGIDEKVSYNITVTNGQVNIASDNSTINATNNVGSDVEKIASLINDVRVAATGISDEDAETLSDNLEVIEEQVKAERPKKGFIRTALAGLKTIKGTVEFASAVAALTEFLMTALN